MNKIDFNMKLLVLAVCLLAVSAYEQIKVYNSIPEPRIFFGKEASDTDFPHHVALFITKDGINGEMCGGALLTEDIVLTAAHCFFIYGKQGMTSVGTNRYMNGINITFNRVILHENFVHDIRNPVNDIALLKLDEPVKIDGVKVKTIALNSNRFGENTHVTICGYGLINGWEPTDVFYYTNLTTISDKKCKEIYNGINIGDKVVCVKGEKNENTCLGDSGGALVVNWPENPTHVGIVSFTKSCMGGGPSVYTRTADYIDWILENAKLL